MLNFIANHYQLLNVCISVVVIDLVDLTADVFAGDFADAEAGILVVLIFGDGFSGAVDTQSVITVV